MLSEELRDKIYTLRLLVNMRESVLKNRVAFDNASHIRKIGSKYTFDGVEATLCENNHLVLKKDDKEVKECPICHTKNIKIVKLKPGEELISVHEKIVKLQDYIENLIKTKIQEFPESTFLLRIKGLGVIGTAYLLAYLYPPTYDFYAPKAFSYTGLSVLFYCPKCDYYAYGSQKRDNLNFIIKDGKRYCPKCGSELLSKAPNKLDIKKYGIKYNVSIKSKMEYVIPSTLIRSKGVYYSLFKQAQEEISRTHPNMNKRGVLLTAYRVIMRKLITDYVAVSAVLHKRVSNFIEGLKLALGNTYDKLSKHPDWIPFPLADYESEYNAKTQRLSKEAQEFLDRLGVSSDEAVKFLTSSRLKGARVSSP